MGADSYNTCPACYCRATGVPVGEVTQLDHLNRADDASVEEEGLREYHEHYIDKGNLIFEYHGASCDNCDYEIPPFKMEHPIPTDSGD